MPPLTAVSRRKELQFQKQGFSLVAGVDEAGIGPLAGPVVAAAVIMDPKIKIRGLDDSKKLTPQKREELYSIILDSAVSIGIGIVDSTTIDRINILQASLKAMYNAVTSLSKRPNHVLIDGIRTIPRLGIPQTAVKHGDGTSDIIAAASIIAKVTRDRIMNNYDLLYPLYNFSDHKGYGTDDHMDRLIKYGPSSIHRFTYQPVIEALSIKGILIF